MHIGFSQENLKEISHGEDQDMDGKTILKWKAIVNCIHLAQDRPVNTVINAWVP
jgi:hypothetical protein